MKKLKVTCLCHEQVHYIDRSQAGKVLLQLRKKQPDHAHMVRMSKLAAEARAKK